VFICRGRPQSGSPSSFLQNDTSNRYRWILEFLRQNIGLLNLLSGDQELLGASEGRLCNFAVDERLSYETVNCLVGVILK
jgi:hypothetical protein